MQAAYNMHSERIVQGSVPLANMIETPREPIAMNWVLQACMYA
jgi:hypothetical protein